MYVAFKWSTLVSLLYLEDSEDNLENKPFCFNWVFLYSHYSLCSAGPLRQHWDPVWEPLENIAGCALLNVVRIKKRKEILRRQCMCSDIRTQTSHCWKKSRWVNASWRTASRPVRLMEDGMKLDCVWCWLQRSVKGRSSKFQWLSPSLPLPPSLPLSLSHTPSLTASSSCASHARPDAERSLPYRWALEATHLLT